MLKFIKLNEQKQPVEGFDVTYTSLDTLENAGIKLNNKTVIVDFDAHDEQEIQQLTGIIDYIYNKYPTLKVKTTRGVHLYYRVPDTLKLKNWTGQMCQYGFKVDYKTGTTAQGVIKLNGMIRETNRPLDAINFSSLPELPIELYPLPKSKNNIMLCIKEGDGRNDALFKHLLCVKDNKNTDLTQVADFINNYVFAMPLPAKELETLVESVKTRETDDSEHYNGDDKDMIAFGQFIAKKLDVKIYKSALYFKDGLYYSRDTIKMCREANKFLALRNSQMKELEHQLYMYGELIPNKQVFSVKLRNGVIVEDNVVDYDCGFTPFYLDVSYNSEAYDKNVDDFLNFLSCNRQDMRLVLEEILGHILLTDQFPHKLFVFTGSGGNGKSAFVEMVTNFASSLASHVDIGNFDDGTSVVSMVGKLVNIADDIDALYLEKSKNIKTMASGNTIALRPIYGQPVEVKNTATLIFTANEPPNFKDKSDGIKRRLLIIPFENKVKERNANLDKLLSTDNAKSYLLNLALQGVKRIYDNKLELTDSITIKNATDQYYLDTDSALAYLNEYPDIENNPLTEIYKQYVEYCNENNFKPFTSKKFGMALKSIGYTSKPMWLLGKTIRTIVKE